MSEFQDHSQLQENIKSKFISRCSELISVCIYIKKLRESIARYKLGNYEGGKYQNCEIKNSYLLFLLLHFYIYIYVFFFYYNYICIIISIVYETVYDYW